MEVRSRLVCVALLAAGMVRAESGGAPEGSSGAPGEDTCTACHGGTANSGGGKVSINFGGTTFTPGQKSRVRVVIEDANASRWGFQLSTRGAAASNRSAGVLATANDTTRLQSGGNVQWITHSASGTQRGTRDSATFEFDWTAPDADAGAVTMYVAANAANNNGANSGDRIYTATLVLQPGGAGGSKPAFTSTAVGESLTGRAGLAPSTWISITGTDLAGAEANWSPVAGSPLPTKLGGVSVKVGETQAAVSFVSPTRITFLAPANVPEGDVAVVVDNDGRLSDSVMVKAAAVLPAISSVREGDSRYHAAVTPAGAGLGLGLVMSRGWILGKPAVDSRAARGAFPGEEVDFYVTGLGAAEETPTDRLFSGAFPVKATVKVRFGDTSVDATVAQLVSPGVYLVRAKVPDSAATGDLAVVVEANGIASGPGVTLNISAR